MGQQPSAPPFAVVPQLVNFSGKAVDTQGKTISGIAGVTFAIYKDQYEGAPLWMETQNVTADRKGNYTVLLGAASSSSSGLPLDLFSTGEARWLGVRINGGEEQPRVLLLSVPYALKAADAQTLGGLPASAFVLATPPSSNGGASSMGESAGTATSATSAASSDVTTSGGTVNALPLWTTGTNIQSSALTQSGSGTTARIGVNTATPASTLDVNGAETVRGNLSLPATGAATATTGKDSQPTTLTASAYNSTTKAAVAQNFRWQAEPANNDSASPSATLNLLYGLGTTVPAETGLRIGSKGILGFAPGQTFPLPAGAVTDAMLANPSLTVATSTPLTGGGAVALGGMTAIGLRTCSSDQILQFVSGAWTCADLAGALGGIQEFTSSGTLTVPSGVTHLLVEMWGGGGGGGGSASIAPGSGGGAGGYTRAVVPVTSGAAYHIVVGSGGAAGSDGVITCTLSGCTSTSASGTPGKNGGSSEITDSSSNLLARAEGGAGGSPGTAVAEGLTILPSCGPGGAGGVGTSSTNSIGRTGGSGQQCNLTSAPSASGAGGIPTIGSIPQSGAAGGAGVPVGTSGAQNAGSAGYILITY
jgi:hypothetical protein